ncbi:MAG: 4Fe-4S dicluster domain-containing protein [Spirochaetales bacterium]|uniref:4Fe-4S dicluster domain-containing protein n=1 Tax=Candidatus Thalassospirochaeta sargassi TaxID=3119039 RepID=A0AAJ1IGT4_9SPIO|nr:4Fe-4S dicluster domain-containing protein [Spirochaetales bacterium]
MKNIPLLALKLLLGIYIAFCLIIAALNYAVAPGASARTAEIISNIWHFYENEFKTGLILAASVLSLILIKKNERNVMRRKNYIGFLIAALAVHIIGPVITGTKELYFFSMPLPWSSFSIQVFNPSTSFHHSFTSHWGLSGIGALLVFVVIYNIVIFAGTLLFGRRLQCSQLCLFNGFASEVFSETFPLLGKKKKKAGSRLKTFFSIMRVILLAVAAFFTLTAALSAAGIITESNNSLLHSLESYKYLTTELLMAMFFWVVFTGRGYCHYCPAGTVLAFLSRAAGQKIRTDLTDCIECGRCSRACPMSIDVKSFAAEGKSVVDFNCVGCGHCVDVCPTATLGYSTRFLDYIKSRINNEEASQTP